MVSNWSLDFLGSFIKLLICLWVLFVACCNNHSFVHPPNNTLDSLGILIFKVCVMLSCRHWSYGRWSRQLSWDNGSRRSAILVRHAGNSRTSGKLSVLMLTSKVGNVIPLLWLVLWWMLVMGLAVSLYLELNPSFFLYKHVRAALRWTGLSWMDIVSFRWQICGVLVWPPTASCWHHKEELQLWGSEM